jgi:hypothetical protein
MRLRRIKVPHIARDTSGNPLQGALITVRNQDASLATLYASDNPLSTSVVNNGAMTNKWGMVEAYVNQEYYQVTITHASIPTIIYYWHAISGDDRGITGNIIVAGAVDLGKIKDESFDFRHFPLTWNVVGAAGQPTYATPVGGTAWSGTAQFGKDIWNRVHLKGEVRTATDKPTVVNTVIFNLPAGFRPTEPRHVFEVQCRENTSNRSSGAIDITSAGDVIYRNGENPNSTVNLNGIDFPTT